MKMMLEFLKYILLGLWILTTVWYTKIHSHFVQDTLHFKWTQAEHDNNYKFSAMSSTSSVPVSLVTLDVKTLLSSKMWPTLSLIQIQTWSGQDHPNDPMWETQLHYMFIAHAKVF